MKVTHNPIHFRKWQQELSFVVGLSIGLVGVYWYFGVEIESDFHMI